MQKISKKEFIANSETGKKKGLLIMILTAVCALVMVIGYFVTMGTPIYEIPMIGVFVSDRNAAELKEDMVESVDELEDIIDDKEDVLEDILEDDERKALDKVVEVARDAANSLSLNNIRRMVNVYKEIGEIVEEESELAAIGEEMDQITGPINDILDAINNALLIGIAFALAFTVFGGLFHIKGLVITGMILSALHCVLLCGFLFVVLAVVTHAALIFFISAFKKEYTEYCVQAAAAATAENIAAEER